MSGYIVDITRAYQGSEVGIVAEVARRHDAEKVQLLIIGREDQRDSLADNFSAARTIFLPGYPSDVQVVDTISENVATVAEGADGTLPTILSFHRAVLVKSGTLGRISHLFNTRPLRDYLPDREIVHESGWPEQLMPLDSALAALQEALRKAGATGPERSLPKTEIRSRLVRVDERFDKDANYLARTPRLVSILLREARNRGMVRQYGMEPEVRVFLSASPSAPSGAVAIGQVAPESVSSRPVLADGVLPATPSPSQVYGRQSIAPISSQVTPSEHSAIGSGEPVSRSYSFVDMLRSKELGPYPEVRHLLYSEIARVLESEQEVSSIRDLARMAVTATREEAPPEFPRPRKEAGLAKEKYDWRGLEKFAIRIMVRGGLALGPDGTPLAATTSVWEARRAPVLRELPQALSVRLDAEIIMEIVEHFQDVTPEDIDHLAGALLANRDESARDHIDEAIFHLQDTGRVVGNSADGTPDVLLPVPQPEPFVHAVESPTE
ncbi:hypothetical protein [Streptomyces sp. ML-6]|uniref:hypothetical protein n=1 Tax=Streptomyces sp. ML-6 TaxID=2982693 RepID=UPI0024C0380B|nr:hypothetical protein [Streptomyces sp. ML-6]MDK0520904.1 hypothetical protein [Streptomyces sp. ML-6]